MKSDKLGNIKKIMKKIPVERIWALILIVYFIHLIYRLEQINVSVLPPEKCYPTPCSELAIKIWRSTNRKSTMLIHLLVLTAGTSSLTMFWLLKKKNFLVRLIVAVIVYIITYIIVFFPIGGWIYGPFQM